MRQHKPWAVLWNRSCDHKNSNRPGGKHKLPAWPFLTLSGHFGMWVTVWVRQLTHILTHTIFAKTKEKSPKIRRFQDFLELLSGFEPETSSLPNIARKIKTVSNCLYLFLKFIVPQRFRGFLCCGLLWSVANLRRRFWGCGCGFCCGFTCKCPGCVVFYPRRCATAGGWPHHPRGGEAVRITLHIGAFTVTIIVKSRNRHPGR